MAKSKGKSKNKTNAKIEKNVEQKVESKIDEDVSKNEEGGKDITGTETQHENSPSSSEYIPKRKDSKGSKERYSQEETLAGGSGSEQFYSNNDDKSRHDKEINNAWRTSKVQESTINNTESKERYDQREAFRRGNDFKEWSQGSSIYKKEYNKMRRSEPPKIKIDPQKQENYGSKKRERYSLNTQDVRANMRSRDRMSDLYESEYRIYEEEFRRSNGDIKYQRVNEIEQDLFAMSGEYSLAHCVAEDMGMGSGIAVHFRYKFKRIDELLNQRQIPGGLAVLQDDNRYIYYLVTKKHSTGKPTYKTLFSSLQAMRKHIEEHNVHKLAMPRIGCGLDRLEWDNVKFMIEHIFKNVDIDIVICNLQQVEGSSPQSRHKNCKQVNVTYPIHEIDEGTIIIYLSSEDGYISEEMKLLDEKFHFLTDFRYHRKHLRDTIIFTKNESFLLVGCIVKKHESDPIDFAALKDCVFNIMKTNKKYQFSYVGFQALKDERDSCVNYKIINILRNNLRYVDVYICWPGELEAEMSARDRFSDSFMGMTDGNDRYESRDSSGQKPVRQNSFSKKDKRYTNSEENNWRNIPKSESKNSGSFRKNLFESKTEKSFSQGNVSGEYQKDNEYKPSTSQRSTEQDWFEVEESESKSALNYKKTEETMKTPSKSNSKRKDELSDQTVPTILSQSETVATENCEYEKYKQEQKPDSYEKVKIMNNTPSLPEKYSQVCYVSEDMCVQSAIPSGTNIATSLGELLNQNKKEGSCTFIKDGRHYLYCLIVKKLSNSKCKPEMVFASFQHLKNMIVQHQVRKLVIPMMKKCDNDLFNWDDVPKMLEFLFLSTQVELILAPFSQETESANKKNKVTLIHAKHPLFQMKKKSMIIYWASKDGVFSEDMMKLKGKFEFDNKFLESNKRMGEVIKYKQNEDHVLYGCVIKKTQNDPINFVSLERCIRIVSDTNVEGLVLAAASAVEDEDEVVNHKIINVLLNNLHNVSLSFCWPGNLKEKMPSRNA